MAERTEREAVEAATAVVAVTEAARDIIRGRYPEQPADKFVSISNGYDGAPPTTIAAQVKAETVTLTYLGSVYGSTEPSSFVEAVLGLPPDVRARLRIRFVGHCEKAAYREALLRMGDTVTFKWLSAAGRGTAAAGRDGLRPAAVARPGQRLCQVLRLPAFGQAILAAVHPDGDVRRRLEETRGGRWADIADVDAIRAMLVAAIEQPAGEAFQPDLEAITRYHRKPLAGQYAALLQTLDPS